MTDRHDDDFRVRPGAPKNRGKGQGQSFVSKVLKQAGKASGGKSAVRRPAAGGSGQPLSLIHISQPTRLRCISYAAFCLKKK
ncbi:hypothetical protein KZ847_35550, partial [Pseudomonas aeruginosa]